MMTLSNRRLFEIAFPAIPEPVVDVWRTLTSILGNANCLPKKFQASQIAGHPAHLKAEQDLRANPDEIEALIIERDLTGFRVDTGHSATAVDYHLIHAKELGRQSLLGCRIEEKAKALNDWTPLIEGIMAQWSCIGAWQWDNLYRCWQGATSDRGYVRNLGAIPPGTRTYIQKSSCALSPDRELFDISLNPGRPKELLPTIHFYPTAEMWLGPHFWQYAKCMKEEALAADFFLEKRDTPHFLYLKSWPEPFTRPDGEQGRQQQKLWQLFFHEDCEWPPGSGRISDKAVYGPPELMPKGGASS